MDNPFWQFVKSLPSPRRAALERFLDLTADPSQIGLKHIWGNQAAYNCGGAPAGAGGMSSMKPKKPSFQQPYLNDHITILERALLEPAYIVVRTDRTNSPTIGPNTQCSTYPT